MPVADKNIAGKIVDILQKNSGRVDITMLELARNLSCSSGSLYYSLKRLIESNVVTIESEKRISRAIVKRVVLHEKFKEGPNWHEVIKSNKDFLLTAKPETEPLQRQSAPAKTRDNARSGGGCGNEECLRVRVALLGELVEIFERLKISQEKNQTLRSTVAGLIEKMEILEEEVERKKKVCGELRGDVDQLESRLRMLRSQTSQQIPTPTGRKVSFDSSGVMVLQREGLPDKS